VIPPEVMQTIDLYVCGVGAGADLAGLLLSDRLRSEQPWLRIQTHCGGGSFKSQMKKADKSGAVYALLLGESEIEAGQVTVKDLRGGTEQQTISQDELLGWLTDNMS
jgi:histidyl-tRNA synthetase